MFSLATGTIPQWGAFGTLLVLLALALTAWIKGIPERLRVKNEREAQDTKAASDIRDEYALRYKETRLEVHGLRNELQIVRAELAASQTKSMRRSDKLNMVLFILRMVMDELQAKEPKNKVLAQAVKLLSRVEDEPHDPANSDAVNAAEHTVEVAKEAVHEVKAAEARK
jgi:hypothetical protein